MTGPLQPVLCRCYFPPELLAPWMATGAAEESALATGDYPVTGARRRL